MKFISRIRYYYNNNVVIVRQIFGITSFSHIIVTIIVSFLLQNENIVSIYNI